MKSLIHSPVLGAAMLVAATAVAAAEPALLSNKVFAGQALDADGVKAVLLGKKAMIGNTRVVIVIARSGDNQESFLSSHLGMTTDQFNTYWRRLYMTGGGAAPKVVDTEADALKLVADTPGAVCATDSGKADGAAVVLAK